MDRYTALTIGQKAAVHVVGALMVIAAAGLALMVGSTTNGSPAHAEPTASTCVALCDTAPTGGGTVGSIGNPLILTSGTGTVGSPAIR